MIISKKKKKSRAEQRWIHVWLLPLHSYWDSFIEAKVWLVAKLPPPPSSRPHIKVIIYRRPLDPSSSLQRADKAAASLPPCLPGPRSVFRYKLWLCYHGLVLSLSLLCRRLIRAQKGVGWGGEAAVELIVWLIVVASSST